MTGVLLEKMNSMRLAALGVYQNFQVDDGYRLVHAKSCVYIDPYGSQYVKYIDLSGLRFVHPDLPERICTE